MNITIDDSSPLISYSPSTEWDDQSCTKCTAKPPDTSTIQDGTWHDSTHQASDPPSTATVTFTGTGVYVFGITVNGSAPDPGTKNQDLLFFIDDQMTEPAGTFIYDPVVNNATSYRYNVPFFSKSGLNHGVHKLQINVQGNSLCLLDYIVYTGDVSSASPSFLPSTPPLDLVSSSVPSPSTSATSQADPTSALSTSKNLAISIALPIILVFLLVISSIIVVLFLRRRRRRREEEMKSYGVKTPFVLLSKSDDHLPPLPPLPPSSSSTQRSQIQFNPTPPSTNPPTDLTTSEEDEFIIVVQHQEEEEETTPLHPDRRRRRPKNTRVRQVQDRPPAYTAQ